MIETDQKILQRADGATLTVVADVERALRPTEDAWRRFWTAADELRVWQWKPPRLFPHDGHPWRLTLERAPRRLSLEASLEYIEEDELVEITPENIRLRKLLLKESDRRRQARRGA